MKPSKLKSIAYHEAGHAVAAYLLKIPLVDITIVPSKIYDGCVRRRNYSPAFRPDIHSDSKTTAQCEHEILWTLAGTIAETKFTGKQNHRGASKDYSDVVEYAIRLSGNLEQTESVIDRLYARATRLISKANAWRGVEGLADALLMQKQISAGTARKIIRAAMVQRQSLKSQ